MLSNIGCIKYLSFIGVSTLGRLSIKLLRGLCVYVSFRLDSRLVWDIGESGGKNIDDNGCVGWFLRAIVEMLRVLIHTGDCILEGVSGYVGCSRMMIRQLVHWYYHLVFRSCCKVEVKLGIAATHNLYCLVFMHSNVEIFSCNIDLLHFKTYRVKVNIVFIIT